MDDFWGVTILLLIIVIGFAALTVRVMGYYSQYSQVRHPRVRFTDCEPLLKSGDIVYFIGHAHGFTNSVFTKDLFSHAGVVVEDEGVLYLTESTIDSLPDPETGAEVPMTEGTQLFPLRRRLAAYPGAIFVSRLRAPLSAAQEVRLRELAAIKTPYPSMSQLVKALFQISSASKARHCMQHIAWLLDELGLAPADLAKKGKTFLGSSGCYKVSKRVTSLAGVPLGRDGANRYGAIHELLYDGDAVLPGAM